ncbi:NAD(P)/FAD-dependent oxidoreductase [Flavobacterium jejuense]|uniref:NAD(P)/FAD-dependent oxidoreductase n=1 Tax=Flavobacterium jejuense TaxID=1544455 RepID=A0ABX0INN1_9FLAO|nr:NAD(P)/FAD-dependent oxidoreductase [Flavobacterium jejuense]NHN25412.1 NAD(P)/FAD-dependent oxidoreductase [Flavobacterium jejuense]
MENKKEFDAVIVGGSYAGLSAAMTLGRSLRSVLIIDSGKPCNLQTPHSHNFITQDGATPRAIFEKAKAQVLEYPTVKFIDDSVISVSKILNRFKIVTQLKQEVKAKKILFTTGVNDIMPNLKGFAECWGISVLHCPYCHGYEVAKQNLGIIANGETAFDLCKLIQHWSDKLTLFTNGKSELTIEQLNLIKKLKIEIIEKEIEELIHKNGILESLSFIDGTKIVLDAIFSRVPFKQHCEIPITMGCQTTEQGHITVDFSQKTNIDGVFCAGDNTSPFRTVSLASSSGTKAGAFINMELLNEELNQI